jgi:hypothetical protein
MMMNGPGSNTNSHQVLDMDPYDQNLVFILKEWAAQSRPPHAVRARLLLLAAAQGVTSAQNSRITTRSLQARIRRSVGGFETNPALHSFHLGMGVLSLMR